jgi:sarcinarray family protein
MILLTEGAAAENPYGKIYTYDVYYNDKLLPGTDVAKPILKIGEPFSIGFNITVHQKCYVSVILTEIGDNDFEIVNGSTSKMKDYGTELMEKNSSKMFYWTVKPTNSWKGGSLPINLVSQQFNYGT